MGKTRKVALVETVLISHLGLVQEAQTMLPQVLAVVAHQQVAQQVRAVSQEKQQAQEIMRPPLAQVVAAQRRTLTVVMVRLAKCG